jgi:hypothetical protein
MNVKTTPFPGLTVVKKVKRIVVAIAGETMLAAGITLMALVVLVLLVFPGGVEVLAIEWKRAKRWMRKARNFLPNKEPRRKQEAVLVSPLVNYFRDKVVASLHNAIPSTQTEMPHQPKLIPEPI